MHVHAYDEDSGRQRDDWETYARIIEGIRAREDVIVYPTIPLQGANRFAHLEELAQRGLIEWMVLDPGSVNFVRYDALEDAEHGLVYANSFVEIAQGMRIARAHGLHPAYAVYEPGFTRLGVALAAGLSGAPSPIYRFMFSQEFAWGFPPREAYLDAHVMLLRELSPDAPWMIGGLGVDVRPLIPHAVRMGGHVRVGLEDAPWGSGLSNLEWVRSAADAIRKAGGEIATAAQVRATLRAGV